jgi:hypothetical protein
MPSAPKSFPPYVAVLIGEDRRKRWRMRDYRPAS